ncbi:DUF2232 domain-containing protein [Marichromatium sp. AB31]|uniref:DUF2232 domain-containing protein n=1 Tax=Marichromatium sp. AB31 TaxID=2483362 RepID=UPI000F3B36BE|nr:DUF2232 domain-containing protein [Marichromatium sp. AB31]RNE91487.1 DUF2232 domain-containing protein [Marichromatium sp. AB31]
MKSLASFIMRGPSQAALVAATSALLSVMIPVFGVVAAAAVGLVTLRNGARGGALVALLATLGAGLFYGLVFGAPLLVLGVLLLFWVPIWGLALVLRYSRSLALTVESASLLVMLGLVLVYAIVGDPAVFWARLLELMREAALAAQPDGAAANAALFGELARWMTGAFAMALTFQVVLALFLARWWQAQLYNPGGFGEGFRAYRLHRAFALLALLLIAGWALVRGPGLLADLALVAGVGLLLQGLAVVHQLRVQRGSGTGWLVLLYVLLVLLPQMAVAIAALGLLDVWVDIRARAARLPSRRR